RPGEALGDQEPCRKVVASALGEASVDDALIVGRGGGGEREGHGTKAQLEQAVAAGGLGVVVALGGGGAQDFDLACVEAEAHVDRPRLRLERAIVGQEDAGGAAFDQSRRNGGALDVGERLGGEHHRYVFLAQGL